MAEADPGYGTSLSIESMKVIAESVGLLNLPDDGAKELADDISYRLKILLQDATKFMHHAKREKLMPTDIDNALKIKNIEPTYGYHTSDHIPFRFASGGVREFHFIEEKDIDLNEIISGPMSKLPLAPSIRAHWLCIDGVQPTIPENPPPISKDLQKLESIDPITKLKSNKEKEKTGKPTTGKLQKLRNVETVHVKQLATHELSVEQQLYYKEITEACVGSDEGRRAEALQSLASDPGLHEMLPRMCTFIAEGVKVNVVQNNLALLIYLMRMVKALLDNPSLYLEKYLHELIPSVLTCIVSKQLCMRPELDNHWALRDFASRLMTQICKHFHTSTNNLQTRVTRIFSSALQNVETPLPSLYGALQGLSELGTEVIKVFILPRVKNVADRIESCLDGPSLSNIDKISAGHIKHLLVKNLTPILKLTKSPPDFIDDYRNEFGCLGPALQASVIKARTQVTMPTPTVTPTAVATTSSIIHPSSLTAPSRMVYTGTRPVGPASNPQKYVIVTSRPQTPGTIGLQQAAPVTVPAGGVRFQSTFNAPVAHIRPHSSTSQNPVTKVVVVCVANSGTTNTGPKSS